MLSLSVSGYIFKYGICLFRARARARGAHIFACDVIVTINMLAYGTDVKLLAVWA